jgi:ESF2/ABP1 family protein
MAKPTDERFSLTDEFECSPATSSNGQTSRDSSEVEDNRATGQDSEQDYYDDVDGLGDGMDADGLAGPKIVKPLAPEALAAFLEAEDNAGIIYISRIPPGMQPTKVRHLMSQYGEVGRVYLQKEGKTGYILDRT